MPKREDYDLLWSRYQKEGVPNRISIERFCFSNGFSYRGFEKWYKQMRCSSFAPIQVTSVPLDVAVGKESPLLLMSLFCRMKSSPLNASALNLRMVLRSENVVLTCRRLLSCCVNLPCDMFALTGNYTYYINQGSTDMRCGIDKLSYIVRTKMGKDPCSGDVFIFMSKSRKVVKILRAEGNAFVLYEKRLTGERYLRPVYNEETGCYQMSWNSFVLLMQGVVRKELLMSAI